MFSNEKQLQSIVSSFEFSLEMTTSPFTLSNTFALQQVHVQCPTVVTALEAAIRFSGILMPIICPAQIGRVQQALSGDFSSAYLRCPPEGFLGR
ncbi:hypothetical protein AVEN_48741-1 [Araneus ventricosus]|uniref:Uncharacterized protein n=1 Tax=Araneus ventricosus TaxID=182803 RepID=A0A4Y2IVC7_ARAVE|nr:hypothetical protein AVEN_48741-1 [Araneus ventricosus]